MNTLSNFSVGGVSDEAGQLLSTQLRVFKELKWKVLDLRTVDGVHIADSDDRAFTHLMREFESAGLRAGVLCSRIGNWSRPITNDFRDDINELKVLAKRAPALKTRLIRIMSYPNDGLSETQWRRKAIARVAELVACAEDNDVCLLHENCSGWGAQGIEQTLELLETVDSPCFGCLFDFGNSIQQTGYSIDWLYRLMPWIRHVHVKDAIVDHNGVLRFVLPGMGLSHLLDGIRILRKGGFQGDLCIEPHTLHQPHLGVSGTDKELAESFIEYGKAFEALLASCFVDDWIIEAGSNGRGAHDHL